MLWSAPVTVPMGAGHEGVALTGRRGRERLRSLLVIPRGGRIYVVSGGAPLTAPDGLVVPLAMARRTVAALDEALSPAGGLDAICGSSG